MIWQQDVNGRGVPAAAAALGMTAMPGRTWGPCPCCLAEHRGASDRRGPIGATARGWACWRPTCEAQVDGRVQRDAVSLVAWVTLGRSPRNRQDWQAVHARAHQLGLCVQPPEEQATTHIDGAARRARWRQPQPRPQRATAPETPQRPPLAEVEDLWGSGIPVHLHPEASRYLQARGLPPDQLAELGIARALPLRGRLPSWAAYRGESWRELGCNLLVPSFDAFGEIVSLRARWTGTTRVGVGWRATAPPHGKKTLRAVGDTGGGWAICDAEGRRLLRAGPVGCEWWSGVVHLAEGEIDAWTLALHPRREAADGSTYAVIGYVSGSWSAALAERLSPRARVIVHAHRDEKGAGLRLAQAIAETLSTRCASVRIAEVNRGA